MSHNRIKSPLHLRLTNSDWLECFTQLNRAELGVLFYIRTLDPFGDRSLNVNSQSIAEVLEIHRSSVSRALKKLEALGFIELEIVTAKASTQAQNVVPTSMRQCVPTAPESTTDVRQSAAPARECTSSVHQRANQPAEALHNNNSSPPQTLQTYSDFINTLSESERESFWAEGQRKASQLPKPPQLPLKWIEANWMELYQQFKSTAVGRKISISDKDWTQHPDWHDWLAMMREGVPKFVALGTWFDHKTRRIIADWALERNLVWQLNGVR